MNKATDNLELLYEKAKRYTETSIELYKLQAVDKSADVLSSLISKIAIGLAVAMFLLFLNIGISLVVGEWIGNMYVGFFIVSAFHLLVAILIYATQHTLIKEPITNMIIGKLLTSKNTKKSILDTVNVELNKETDGKV